MSGQLGLLEMFLDGGCLLQLALRWCRLNLLREFWLAFIIRTRPLWSFLDLPEQSEGLPLADQPADLLQPLLLVERLLVSKVNELRHDDLLGSREVRLEEHLRSGSDSLQWLALGQAALQVGNQSLQIHLRVI